MIMASVETQAKEGGPHRQVQFPITEFQDSYKMDMDYLAAKAYSGGGGIGLFAHPPFVQYKGGQIQPITISTKLVAGMSAEDAPTYPNISSGADGLIELVETLYSMSLPQDELQVVDLYWPPFCSLKIIVSDARGTFFEPRSDSTKTPFPPMQPAWFDRSGYVTEVTAKFGAPWDYATGKPMYCELSFTFMVALAPLVRGKDAAQYFPGSALGNSLSPRGQWKFNK